MALLFSEARIVELSGDIRQAKAALISAQSQNDYYTTTLNVQSSISNVESVAWSRLVRGARRPVPACNFPKSSRGLAEGPAASRVPER